MCTTIAFQKKENSLGPPDDAQEALLKFINKNEMPPKWLKKKHYEMGSSRPSYPAMAKIWSILFHKNWINKKELHLK